MKLYKCTKNIFGFEKRIRKFCCLPSDEGSGLKYLNETNYSSEVSLPSDEGSGLQGRKNNRSNQETGIFLHMMEVAWNPNITENLLID